MSTLRTGGHSGIEDGGIGRYSINSHTVEQLQRKLPLPGLLCRADQACVGDRIAPMALIDLQSTSQSVSWIPEAVVYAL